MPIGDDLAARLRRGAAGHTPGAPSDGWVFPEGGGGYLAATATTSPPNTWATWSQGVLPEGYSMHSLRHLFASRAYQGHPESKSSPDAFGSRLNRNDRAVHRGGRRRDPCGSGLRVGE